jgi:hypothetical protein
MSAVPHTASVRLGVRVRLSRGLVTVALVVALAASGLTAALVASHAASGTPEPQGQRFGTPAALRGVPNVAPSRPVNRGHDRPRPRP